MSYSANVPLSQTGDGDYVACFLKNEELDKLYKKYGLTGKVNISITKPKDNKTAQQVKTIHALLNAFFYTNLHSAPDDVTDTDRFKLWCKVQYGKCSEVEIKGKIIFVPWSISDYSKDDLIDFIDKILTVINMTGANHDKKIAEIIEGMESNSILNS